MRSFFVGRLPFGVVSVQSMRARRNEGYRCYWDREIWVQVSQTTMTIEINLKDALDS